MKLLPVAQPNACGPCTLCCKLYVVQDLTPVKPKDAWCPHAVKARGCSIYDHRPPSCRKCMWLDQNLDARMRPDRVHGVLTGTSDGRNLVLQEDPGWRGFARVVLEPFIRAFTESGKCYVAIVCGAERVLVGQPELLARLAFDVADVDPARHAIVEREES